MLASSRRADGNPGISRARRRGSQPQPSIDELPELPMRHEQPSLRAGAVTRIASMTPCLIQLRTV